MLFLEGMLQGLLLFCFCFGFRLPLCLAARSFCTLTVSLGGVVKALRGREEIKCNGRLANWAGLRHSRLGFRLGIFLLFFLGHLALVVFHSHRVMNLARRVLKTMTPFLLQISSAKKCEGLLINTKINVLTGQSRLESHTLPVSPQRSRLPAFASMAGGRKSSNLETIRASSAVAVSWLGVDGN